MRCPKCHFDHRLQTTECLKCGIVFSRYQAAIEVAARQPALTFTGAATMAVPMAASAPASDDAPWADRSAAFKELKCRLLALPAALLLARLLTGTGFRMVSGMLAMVLHESGHAITAWLTGRWAIPLLWVTPHGQDRSWAIVFGLAAAILFGGFLAWRTQRWAWVVLAGVLFSLQIIVQLAMVRSSPGALIVFMGEGGAMILATLLMTTFYAPRESALSKSWGLRWGLLFIGALSFMHVFLLWRGPIENLPFGEIEGVNLSDPSLLTEMYGWPVLQMVDRYVRLGFACLVALFAVYVWGLLSAYLAVRRSPSRETQAG